MTSNPIKKEKQENLNIPIKRKAYCSKDYEQFIVNNPDINSILINHDNY